MSKPPVTCAKCFANSEFPGTVIGPDGRCNWCESNDVLEHFGKHKCSNAESLQKLVDTLKAQKTGKYDCIIGASGGFDSSYVIYIAKRELGLNPLVVKYDHGFNYESSNENLRAVCTALGVDLRFVSSPDRRDIRFVERIAKAMRHVDIYWGICLACHYVLPAAVVKVASEEGIPMMLASSNFFEAMLRVPQRFKFRFVLRSMIRVAPWKWPAVLYDLSMAMYHLFRLRLQYYIPPITNLFRSEPKWSLKTVHVSKYFDWDVDAILAKLEQLGWKSPVGRALPMRFDCMIDDSFMNYTFQKATGQTTHAIIANNLIYAGVRTKEEMQATIDEYERSAASRTHEELLRIQGSDQKTTPNQRRTDSEK
jgi:hypothetical protein